MHGNDMDELTSQLEPEQLLESPDFHRLNVLDLILGHEDRHAGNILWSMEGGSSPENLRMVAIDNGLSLGSPMSMPGMQVYAHPFGQFFENDPDLSEADAKAQQTEYRERGDKAVAKALSSIDPKLHEQLKQVDLSAAAKAMTASGLNDEKAVRAALVRIAALQEDPRIFAELLKRQGGKLDAAWQDFQFSSGQNDNLLWMAGAGDREDDIDAALDRARPQGGWQDPGTKEHIKDMERIMADMDGWGDTQPPDAATRPEGPKETAPEPEQEDDGDDEDLDWSKLAVNVMERWALEKMGRRGRKLTVSSVDPRNLKKRELGVFELGRDGKVREQYRDHRFKNDIRRGIRFMGKKIKPEDGPRFMAVLEKVYGARSLYDVKRT